jgi:hypothetical protein
LSDYGAAFDHDLPSRFALLLVKCPDVSNRLAKSFEEAGFGAGRRISEERHLDAKLIRIENYTVELLGEMNDCLIAAGPNAFDDMGDASDELRIHVQRAGTDSVERRVRAAWIVTDDLHKTRFAFRVSRSAFRVHLLAAATNSKAERETRNAKRETFSYSAWRSESIRAATADRFR